MPPPREFRDSPLTSPLEGAFRDAGISREDIRHARATPKKERMHQIGGGNPDNSQPGESERAAEAVLETEILRKEGEKPKAYRDRVSGHAARFDIDPKALSPKKLEQALK